jgi:hypothetical protein
MMEVWKDIEGYEGLYQISNQGRVKSLAKSHRYGSKEDKILKSGKTIKQRNGLDYPRVCLSKYGNTIVYQIHRLVAISFIPNPLNKDTVNHMNGIKNDNRVDNLEWATMKEQNEHAWNTGLKVVTDKWREAMKLNIGRKHSDESKFKMRQAKLGKEVSEETRLKLSMVGKGRKHSDESIEKMRQKRLGKLLTNESKEKISKANKGKTAWNKGMTKQQEYEYRTDKKNTIGNLVGINNKNNNIQHR